MTAATPAADGRKRFSLEVLQGSRAWRAAFGIILAGSLLAAVLAIVAAFTGKLTNVVAIRGELPGSGNALPVGSLVLYRNVTVGKIGTEGTGPHGTIAVTFDIYPAKAANVPSNVQAMVAPLSIFGNQAVNLVLPSGAPASAQMLQAGSFITPDTQTASSSLQQSTTQIFNLLNAVHPADLDKALTPFATALNGEGAKLGQTLASFDNYLKVMNPQLPTVNADLNLIPPAVGPITTAAPDIIATLGNSVTTGHTITDTVTNGTADIKTLLSGGNAALGQLTSLLTQVQDTLPNLINGSGQVLADINGNLPASHVSNLLSRTLAGLQTFASAVAASETSGPFLALRANLPVFNVNAAVEAALNYGSPSQLTSELAAALGKANFNPAPYSSANCPGSASGANLLENDAAGLATHCSGAPSPAVAPAGTGSSGSPNFSGSSGSRINTAAAAGPVGLPSAAATVANPFAAEVSAVQSIATALGGGRAPAVPAEASMVLLPLYASMAKGS